MSDIFDHDMVETRTGNFPVLQDDERSIPFHWVDDMKALIAGGHWTPEALEAVIGEPRDYASRIVRLFVVLPKLTVDDVNIPDMARMLDAYAKAHGLSIKVTYFPTAGGRSEKVFFNTKGDDQIWVSIDILTREVIDQIVAQGQDPGMAVMNDMHITPGRAYLDAPWSPPTSDIDIDAMAPGCHLRFPRNERYDYNTVIVHRVVGGQYVHKSYPIGMIYFRRQSFVL